MNAIDLITYDIPPLVHTDSGEKAMNWMDEFKVSHLPVLKNGNYVGLVSETDILDKLDFSEDLDVLFQHLPRPYVKADAHLFEILAKISEFKISVMPILDDQEKYLGCTNIFELMTTIANTSSMKEKGGILVLEVSQSDYSMAQIGQIVESNNAKILSSTILSDASSTNLDITLKINQLDLTHIIQTFERYDYVVKAQYQNGMGSDDLKLRYDILMNYLKY
ncbi:MAG: CBS domain-containing protein [Crocinitomicaceae bacterium]|jgi:CBS domain-containing protein|tara:strand:+ start:19529 stop:20191 length:663 start_codon:yes stop_codon:yes gene_type:complete